MFTPALFKTVKKWEKCKCPSANEWVSKTCYIHKKYYSTIKNEVLIHCITQINLKNIMLSEKSQSQKSTHSMIPLI